ncbi:MAG TPA: histidine kinase [Cyanobacteria bacterium UBA11372]|nr:histidine kinase [Cyanobacteria bacterium UBA11372]HBE30888.1 histidine kinase [Cyanobacteria bacterium UBA11368]
MSRSIRVAPACIPQVKLALLRCGFPSQKALAEELGISRGTTDKFFTGKPVDFRYFVEISQKLGLDWQAIAYTEQNPPIETKLDSIPPQTPQQESLNIDTLVEQVRRRCHDKILLLYGKMQLLDISQPIDLDRLYVDVNILEQITSQRWLEITDLVRGFNPSADNFDRFGLGKVRQERVPGLEAVKRYDRLMVLGKPGSGKTTFLQHVAIECVQGRFQANRVPIFIRLKDFAKYAREPENFRLLDYISREFRCCGISEQQVTEAILTQGRGLILLDGLDEVTDEDENKVVEELQQFSEDYYKNQLIINCRIAASKYRFPGFTDVEVADFNDAQIESFAQKWFVAVARNNVDAGLATAKQFIQKLNRSENQQIRELAITPILLHLTCLVFQSKTDFPSNRSKLYAQGIEILLKRWDETRGIQRDEVYRSLTLPRKKQLLAQIAAITFERGDYFFEQGKIQQLIADYLGTLPNAKTEPDELQMDSEAVLKSIEAQHGLLVERARGIYSFSHLTFQEYFTSLETVRKIVSRLEPQALKNLVNYIKEKQWREVFLLTAEMLPRAECILLLIKQQIDRLLAEDEKLQQFLAWANQKTLSVEIGSNKPAAIRAFYIAVAFARDLGLTLDLDLYGNRNISYALKFDIYPNNSNLEIAVDLDLGRILARSNDMAYGLNYTVPDYCKRDFSLPFHRIFECEIDIELRQALQQFKNQLPNSELKQWWEVNGQGWTAQLRSVIVKHRNIGHDWLLNEQQKKLLSQYYDANKLLVDCMNSAANLTPAVREEIEETLLLPMAEIEKRSKRQDR